MDSLILPSPFLTLMYSDQCAQNPDGSLKDPKDIQWFNDVEDTQPLPFHTAPAQPLGRGLCNKTTKCFSDAVAREQLDSDDDGLHTFTKPPKRKCAVRASNISGDAALSSSNSFDTLLVEESSDDEDRSFKSDSGSESDDDSGDQSTPDLELISNEEVGIQLFSHNLKYLPNIVAACQCFATEDGCGSQPR